MKEYNSLKEHNRENNEVYSEKVKAKMGKRTYIFDVRATRTKDYYLTITEIKKTFKESGYFYEKHRIFVYKEDLSKFIKSLNSAAEYIKKELIPDYDFDQPEEECIE